MKMEKLTENKIRVIVDLDELNINEKIIFSILKKAEEELNFHTDGCKLLVETFSSFDDFFVFNITKYISNSNTLNNKKIICCFESFDSFCDFCNSIKNIRCSDFTKFMKHSALYLWNDAYYLVCADMSIKLQNSHFLYFMLSEFTESISFSNSFESKLLEHGKVIIKKEAILVGIKYFAN